MRNVLLRHVLHKIHMWAGLTLCLPLVLLGLSGSVLVFEHELERVTMPRVTSATGATHGADDIIAAARAKVPEGFVPSLFRPADDGGSASVFFMRPGRKASETGSGGRMQVLVDPVSLVVQDTHGSGDFLRQLSQFHSSLLLRDYGGRSVVGWFGVAMLVFGLTGLGLWWPRPGQWRKSFSFNSKSVGWKFYRDLHGTAGIWGFLVLIVVSSSGVYLAFPRSLEAGVGAFVSVRDMRAPPSAPIVPEEAHKKMGVDDALRLAQRSVTDSKLVAISLPAKPEQPYRVSLLHANERSSNPPLQVFIDPWSQRVIETRDPNLYPAVETVFAWAHSVHAGQAFGWLWKVLVFFVGLTPLLFTITGLSMWQIKRRRVRRRN
jgi:uncharacterized iron-regulated membrane protein